MDPVNGEADPIAPLASGRDADVWSLPDGWVLRRYRSAEVGVEREARYLRWVGSHGYPVPELRRVRGRDLEMRRLEGITLLSGLMDGSMQATDVGRRIGGLLRRLHQIPSLTAGVPAHWRVRHGDLHPDNVFATPDGDVVIDWTTADDGPPGFDTAHSALILAQVAVLPERDGIVAGAVVEVMTAMLAAADTFDDADLEAAVLRRSSNRTMDVHERAAIPEAARLVRRLQEVQI